MTEPLNPCPSCSNEPHVEAPELDGVDWIVMCNFARCGYLGEAYGRTEEEAVENWNRAIVEDDQ